MLPAALVAAAAALLLLAHAPPAGGRYADRAIETDGSMPALPGESSVHFERLPPPPGGGLSTGPYGIMPGEHIEGLPPLPMPPMIGGCYNMRINAAIEALAPLATDALLNDCGDSGRIVPGERCMGKRRMVATRVHRACSVLVPVRNYQLTVDVAESVCPQRRRWGREQPPWRRAADARTADTSPIYSADRCPPLPSGRRLQCRFHLLGGSYRNRTAAWDRFHLLAPCKEHEGEAGGNGPIGIDWTFYGRGLIHD